MLNGLGQRLDTALLSPLARSLRDRKLTYLTPTKLRVLELTLRTVSRSGIRGAFLEFGVALGGSAILIASYADKAHPFHGYDVFGMNPPPGSDDDPRSHARYADIRAGKSQGIDGDIYYGYVDDLFDRVCRAMAEFGVPVDGRRVSLHPGLFEQTLDFTDPRPVAFAHIDCDWHDPALYCLAGIRQRMVPGGRIVLDDNNDGGDCGRAVDAFLARENGFRLVRRKPSVVLIRV